MHCDMEGGWGLDPWVRLADINFNDDECVETTKSHLHGSEAVTPKFSMHMPFSTRGLGKTAGAT